MKLLKGKKIADKILADLKKEIKKSGSKPALAVILVGKNPASETYVRLKAKAAQKAGIGFSLFWFSEKAKKKDIIAKIKELNTDEKISGMIVQLPLPKKMNTQKIINSVDPEKDADGFHPENLKKFLKISGTHPAETIKPVFPSAIMKFLENSSSVRTDRTKSQKKLMAAVIAKSDNFGKIMRGALEKEGIAADYVLARNIKIPPNPLYKGGGKNLPFQEGVPSQRGLPAVLPPWRMQAGEGFLRKIKSADIVISAVGQPGIITGAMLKKGVIIIDGGISKKGKKILGDVDFESVKNVAGYLSPVPGGVGPVTVACLLENVYLLAKKSH